MPAPLTSSLPLSLPSPRRDYFFIVIELISGGELFDRICEKARYSEREARKVMWLMTSAVAYAHGKGIIHRDLKPENVLLKSKEDDTSIKLADMGFAKILTRPNQMMSTPCGTPGYVAPEVITTNPQYGPKCDIWSLGVIFYILLCGYPPFSDEDQNALFNQIRAGQFAMDPQEWDVISAPAKDLVRKILVVDPNKRLTAAEVRAQSPAEHGRGGARAHGAGDPASPLPPAHHPSPPHTHTRPRPQILQHPWMQLDVSAVPDVDLGASLAKLKKYQARRRLKKAMTAVRVTVRTRMIFAAKAAKAAKLAGANEDVVESVFFEAARKAPSTRYAAPIIIPQLPTPLPMPAVEGRPQQFRVANIVSPSSSVEARAPARV